MKELVFNNKKKKKKKIYSYCRARRNKEKQMSLPATRTVLRDYVALSELNYIYPWGTLPSNNFYRRIRPNPYYLANELRNIEIDLERKPTAYKALPSVGAQYTELPDWKAIGPNAATSILDNSQKILVGPYFDTVNNQAGVQYNYKMQGKLSMICPVEIKDGFVLLALNLLNKPVPSTFTNNLVKYVKIGYPPAPNATCPCVPDPDVLNPCNTISSDPQGSFTPAISGQVALFGNPNDPSQQAIIDLQGAVPYLDCPTCGLDNNVYYAVLGKRLYLALNLKAINVEGFDEIQSAIYDINVSIVEERVPTLFTALSPV